MNQVNAIVGRRWVKEAWQIFRLQPMAFLLLFVLLMMVKLVLGFIPYLGEALSVVITPVLVMGLMQACKHAEQGQRVAPSVLFSLFQSKSLPRLASLGMLYLLASLLALACSSLVDGGAFSHVLLSAREAGSAADDAAGNAAASAAASAASASATGAANAPPQIDPKILIGMLSTALFYVPAMLVFWYAAPLIVWRQMGVAKAIFYSVIAVKRNAAAFAVYGLTWLGLGLIAPSLIGSLFAMAIGSINAALLIVLPISFVTTTVMYCSFYPTYTDVFGKPDNTESADEPPSTSNSDPDQPTT